MNYRIILLFISVLIFLSCKQDTKFDSEEWKNAGGEDIVLDTRLNMVNDLIEKEILLYKNETEIVELVGLPSKLNRKEVDTIKYFAVQEIYGWDIDPEEMFFLKIKFNEKGKSISVEMFSN